MARILTIALFVLIALPAWAADIEGAADHPAVQRYPDSEIIRYAREDFTDTYLFVEAASAYGGLQKNLEHTKALEGAVTRIIYRMPAERSTLEILRNYQQALEGAGFEVLFDCSNEACGGRNFNHAVIPYAAEFAENYKDQRYLLAHLPRPEEGDLYVALYVVRNTSGGGPMKNRVFGHLEVVELTPMDSGLVTVDANAMAKGLEAEGRIALYNVFFAHDSAELQPDSTPALEEIAKLMAEKPELTVLIVGHTDSQGALDYNLELSRRRAAAVVEALAAQHGVARERMTPAGVGFLAPVASNRTEQGRALNRRVELVEYR